MFTVKHIDTDGTERLYFADAVEVVRKDNQFEDGIYLDWPQVHNDPANSVNAVNAMIPRPPAKQVIRFASACSSGDTPPMVFVMNREGSTVASYRLWSKSRMAATAVKSVAAIHRQVLLSGMNFPVGT